MPIFDYECNACGHRFVVLSGMVAESDDSRCPKCGSATTQKRVSRFRIGRDEDARLDELLDRTERIGEPESPTEVRELMREMGRAMDDDASDEMEALFEEEVADELDSGSP